MAEDIKAQEELELENYDKILIECRSNNMLFLDAFTFILNVLLLFVFKGVLLAYPLVTILIILIGLKVGVTGCDLGLVGKYTISNKIFTITDYANNFAFILTIMVILKVIFISVTGGSI